MDFGEVPIHELAGWEHRGVLPAERLTGTLALARIPATLTGKDADTVDGVHAAALWQATIIPRVQILSSATYTTDSDYDLDISSAVPADAEQALIGISVKDSGAAGARFVVKNSDGNYIIQARTQVTDNYVDVSYQWAPVYNQKLKISRDVNGTMTVGLAVYGWAKGLS